MIQVVTAVRSDFVQGMFSKCVIGCTQFNVFFTWWGAECRVEHSRRYRADPSGVRTLCAYLVLRDKVIKPLVVGGERPLGRPPKNLARLINIT